MDLSCQLFFETAFKTLKLQQKPLPLQIFCHINKHYRMKVSSTNIQGKKIMFINDVQAIPLQSERLSEMHFSAVWRPKLQIFCFRCPTWGYLTEIVN